VPTQVVPGAASSLLDGLLGAATDSGTSLAEVARTSLSVHYETGDPAVPVLCLCLPQAVRLPNALVTTALPDGPVEVRAGAVQGRHLSWRVRRWWAPPRPRGLTAPASCAVPGLPAVTSLHPHDLVGAGPGLTPEGDDVLAGALVAAFATDDPRLPQWRSGTRAALRTRRTTAVSRGLLHHALDGWATPELAGFVTAVCHGSAGASLERLLAVGHSSGAALAAGVLHVLSSSRHEGAA
jgi:Protein of unknown function (DUF2877)